MMGRAGRMQFRGGRDKAGSALLRWLVTVACYGGLWGDKAGTALLRWLVKVACSEGAEGDLGVPGGEWGGSVMGEGRVCRGWRWGEWLLADCWCRRLGWGWHGTESSWQWSGVRVWRRL